ncbi:MAG: HyaD/HybD family hydrogenase maturation endopeptidase [Desulfobulbaceae bacterium]|jgi:hydrogenase maturation protease|nr:HyaD/HybD family hydrogenase maturation endopeptidase [Desulfobulbaceae bacterium]MDY0350401.1 HyaD/HybD family hydrogenase maturation endopeptidase [Desulfobulbaceae bacterium]
MHNNRKIGILGLGNILLSDEGFGVHFINFLNERYDIPANVEVLDGGTAGIMMAPFIEDSRILFVIDTVALMDDPGSIHCFSDEDIQARNIQARMSPHQVGLFDILELCRIRGKAPERTEMITVVPKDLSVAIGLTPGLEAKLTDVMEILNRSLAACGSALIPKDQAASA